MSGFRRFASLFCVVTMVIVAIAQEKATYHCTKCDAKLKIAFQERTEKCPDCSKVNFIVKCPGCAKWLTRADAGETTCDGCGRRFAIILCTHCHGLSKAERYEGAHVCPSAACAKTTFCQACPGCGAAMLAEKDLADWHCESCKAK